MLFNSILLGLFGPTVYFLPSDSVCSLGLFLHCLRAPVSHFPLGHPWPICFPWACSAFFLILLSHGPLLTLFRLPWPNYFILHLWGRWVFHYLLTFFAYITLGLLWPILVFLHIAHGFAFSLFPGPFRPVCFFRTHFMSPWAIHSCHLGSMAFSYLLTLVYPCCWVFSFTVLAKNEPQQLVPWKIIKKQKNYT